MIEKEKKKEKQGLRSIKTWHQVDYFKNYMILRKVVSTLTKLNLSYVGEKLLLEKMASNLKKTVEIGV